MRLPDRRYSIICIGDSMRTPHWVPWVYLGPAVAVMAVACLYPLLSALQLGFYDWSMGTPWSAARWVGYLSTTGVYGEAEGGWIDETAPRVPTTDRGRRRVQAEDSWLALHHDHGLPVHLFRLSGIYGPGRSALQTVLSGRA